jgi:hypothetical protein
MEGATGSYGYSYSLLNGSLVDISYLDDWTWEGLKLLLIPELGSDWELRVK